MPLLDLFHPPLSQRRKWESFHCAWAEALALQLNQGLLPARYFAEVHVKVGPRVEIDVGTYEERANGTLSAPGTVAVWAPPQPTLTTPLPAAAPDVFEIQVVNDAQGPQVVAAIELVSPANKDRAARRRQFAVKCASLLHGGLGLIVVDAVTERSGDLHRELLEVLQVSVPAGEMDLYAAAYRTRSSAEALQLDAWVEELAVGNPLPVLPLWVHADLCLPVDLEAAYQVACAARRIGV